jgi:type IV pilus assembly protein PilE
MKHSQSGFTLIELMITVAVVAILASIAYPSYRNTVMRSNRAEAKNALLQVQVAQEKFFLQRNRYAGATPYANSVTELNNAANHATPGLGISSTTPRGHYQIRLDRPSATTFTATAVAIGSQASDTACATLSINELGRKLPDPATSSCWK